MKRTLLLFGGLTLALVLFGVLVASSDPDGLETVAESLDFASRSMEPEAWTPFAGYETAPFGSNWFSQVLAGLTGVALIYGFGTAFARLVRRKDR
jgi:hypothetical protein